MPTQMTRPANLLSPALGLALGLMLAASASAQPTPPPVDLEDPRAQRSATRCLERLARLGDRGVRAQVQQAEAAGRDCASAARREPGPATRRLVAYQQSMLDWAQARVAEEAQAQSANRELERAIRSLPWVDANWGSEDDNARVDREVVTLKAEIDRLAPLVASRTLASLQALQSELLSEASRLQAELDRIDALMGETVADAQYNQVLALEARAYAGLRLIPGRRELAQAHSIAAAWLARLGGRGGARAQQQAARSQEAAARQFPRAVSQDARLESTMRQVFQSQGWNEPIRAVALQDREWSVEQNAAGVVIARRRRAAIGVRLGDGSCRVYDFIFVQPRAGSGWQPLRRSSHSSEPIACENLPAP